MNESSIIEPGMEPVCSAHVHGPRDASVVLHLLLAFGAAWAVRAAWRRFRGARPPAPVRAGGGA